MTLSGNQSYVACVEIIHEGWASCQTWKLCSTQLSTTIVIFFQKRYIIELVQLAVAVFLVVNKILTSSC